MNTLCRTTIVFASLLAVQAQIAHAAKDVEFTAQVDRQQIGLDDSVSLKLTVQSEGGVRVGSASYDAPDFETVNEYTSNFVESTYDSSTGFKVRNNQTLTRVLKPMKTGTLRISGIRILVDGQPKTVPDITVSVVAAGAGTPPPRGYGGGGVGLRGAGKRTTSAQIMVRAETDKDKVVKGEQVIVSYYLYQRVRTLNVSVDKFPTLNGFLREELEMPVMGTQLSMERVILDGVPYQRALLVRYAAYPLQEGKLKIDPLAMKYSYFATPGVSDDGEDPFLNFFQQLSPRTAKTQSEPITIEVGPLPTDGRPASFTGGVGDFNITSAVDKYELRANEAVTLTVKIEGRGNVAAIGEPKAQWPSGVELYDSKGVAKSGRGGVSQKVFEFVLIPRAPGKVTLPGMEFSYYDTSTRKFETRTTAPVELTVNEPAPGSAAPVAKSGTAPAEGTASKAPSSPAREEARGLKTQDAASSWGSLNGLPIWRIFYWLCVSVAAVFSLLIGWDLIQRLLGRARETRQSRAAADAKSWSTLQAQARSAAEGGASWSDVLATYERLIQAILESIDSRYQLGAKSLSRTDLRRLLVDERGFSADSWSRLSRILEHAEMVRYAAGAGNQSELKARSELAASVAEAEQILRTL